MEIPKGNSREDIKNRKQIIKDFYANWIAEHPEKKVWNKSLKAEIHIKYLSINETVGHASGTFESTDAVMSLTEIHHPICLIDLKKSRLGCDFLEGSYQDNLERVVNPFRIPRDDSNAKVTLFLDSANNSYDRFRVMPRMTVDSLTRE